MSNKNVGFLRTPNGVKLIHGKFSCHITYDEIAQLNAFVASGARASSDKLQQNFERASLRSVKTDELERELERRAEVSA